MFGNAAADARGTPSFIMAAMIQQIESDADLAGGATRDPLTGLVSMTHASDMLDRWRAAGGRHIQAMLVALGEMGALNIAFGRTVGDSVLIETARRIAHFADDEFAGQECLIARLGGSSFLVAVREDCTRERWQWLAEALADAIALPFRDADDAASIRLWPRVVLARAGSNEGANALFDKLADGLTRLREGNAARIAWADGEQGQFGAGRRRLERDLLSAIDRDEIGIVYQPQYALSDDRLVGAEALARWQHSKLGQLGAATLFTLAERTDHVAQLSRHILARAMSDAARWPRTVNLSVNVTATDLAAGGFGEELLKLAASAGFPPERLTLEITEQMLLGDIAKAQSTLTQLSGQGVRIALDDFGAGFCNFRYLKLLPVDLLKLDRSMIDGIIDDPRDLSIFRGIVAMAQALDLRVVAEGVESEAQRALIAAEGCAYYQGFLRSPPVGSAEMARMTQARG